METKETKLLIHTDGACSGNPGPMGAGVYITKDEKVVDMISEYLGKGTNNTAELTAIDIALEKAIFYNEKNVELRADSEWCVKVLNNQYRCKQKHLLAILKKIKEKQPFFTSLKFIWIPREKNEVANELATAAVANRFKK